MTPGGYTAQVFSDFATWAKQPYSPNMTAYNWFLLVGLVVVFMIIWGKILNDIKGEF